MGAGVINHLPLGSANIMRMTANRKGAWQCGIAEMWPEKQTGKTLLGSGRDQPQVELYFHTCHAWVRV